MKLYKLTDENLMTHGGFKWTIGFMEIKPIKKNPSLCSEDVFHAYKNKNLALLLNPIHADISDFLLFEAEGEICVEDWGKVGVFELTLTKKMRMPKWYSSDKKKDVQVMFAILCAESVLHLYNGESDAPKKAIEAAKEYLKTHSASAASAASAAADSAYSADSAAASAARSAASAASAADSAVYAAYSASAADSAVYAAYSADSAYAAGIDFCALADKAVKIIMEK